MNTRSASPAHGAFVPTWITAFLDVSPLQWEAATDFWAAVTGSQRPPMRGEHHECVTLLPADGDPVLRVQRLGTGPSRLHLDVHVGDRRAAADAALALGASEVADVGHVELRSPGGMPFCFVHAGESRRPRQVRWLAPGGGRAHTSLVDQVALDIPREHWEPELRFWSGLTGWAVRPSASEFAPLERPAGQPLRLLGHRLDEQTGPVRAHLDLAASDRVAETARHVALGAVVERRREQWTVLRAPDGRRYCVTDRDPETGVRG